MNNNKKATVFEVVYIHFLISWGFLRSFILDFCNLISICKSVKTELFHFKKFISNLLIPFPEIGKCFKLTQGRVKTLKYDRHTESLRLQVYNFSYRLKETQNTYTHWSRSQRAFLLSSKSKTYSSTDQKTIVPDYLPCHTQKRIGPHPPINGE